MLLLLAVIMLIGDSRGELICPLVDGYAKREQTIAKPCFTTHGSGVCDAKNRCVFATGVRHHAKGNFCPSYDRCEIEHAPCQCTSNVVCQRRVGKHAFVYTECVDKEEMHRKRQELLDEVFEDETSGPVDKTGSFVVILLLTYLVVIAIVVIYVKPLN